MGFFDFFEEVGKKIESVGSGIGEKILDAGQEIGRKVSKGFDKAKEVVEEMGKGETWEEGAKLAGKWLRAPQKWIEENDPLAKKMGDFGALSPLSLGASLFTAIPSSAGYLLNFADKKQRDKLEAGDPETIASTVMSGVGVIPMPGGGLAGSAVKGGAKGARALGRAVAKSSLGML
tara:strand:+ start:1260 stop:1787 length:528 start_codon:yes stop_codon:yes gene_type:complete